MISPRPLGAVVIGAENGRHFADICYLYSPFPSDAYYKLGGGGQRTKPDGSKRTNFKIFWREFIYFFSPLLKQDMCNDPASHYIRRCEELARAQPAAIFQIIAARFGRVEIAF